jgi:hypothetical protein
MPENRRSAAPIGALALAAATIVLALAGAAAAHHGWSDYDATKTLDLAGPVRESSFGNPHGTLRLEVDSKVWSVVLAPPQRMRDRGLTPEMIAVGAQVRVVGYPHRQRADEIRVERIIVGEKTVELR